jgi:hypothetical protein
MIDVMSTERVTICIPPELRTVIEREAERAGLSVSAWIARAAEHAARIAEGLRAADEAIAAIGGLSPEAEAEAQRILDEAEARQAARRARGESSQAA